jgi:hypothetical protein
MTIQIRIPESGRAHFGRTYCPQCNKDVLITYAIPLICNK